MCLLDHPSLLRVYMTPRSGAPIESVFSVSCSCIASLYTDGRWGLVVNSTACLTLSLWRLVVALPPLCWSHSSLCPPQDQCAYHRQTKRLTVKTTEWSSNVIGLFSFWLTQRMLIESIGLLFKSGYVHIFWCVYVYMCTFSCIFVCVWTLNTDSIGIGLFSIFSPLEATVDLFMKCKRGIMKHCTVDVA